MKEFLIELGCIHLLLTLGYLLLLRKEKQYRQMRFYLLLSPVFALFIPFLSLPNPFLSPETINAVSTISSVQIGSISVNPVSDNTNWTLYAIVIGYAAISIYLLFDFLKNIFHIRHLARKSRLELIDDRYVRRNEEIKGSFSFFGWIFISNEIRDEEETSSVILQHEQAHVQLRHSYDLIYLELVKVCFWWLPSIWYSLKEIKKIHEYEADAHTLKNCSIDQYSSILISTTLKTNGLSMASSFHDGLIFKRLEAMKTQTNKVSTWKMGSLATLTLTLFLAFACTERPIANAEQNNKVFTIVEGWADYPGGMDAYYQQLMKEVRYPEEARTSGITGQTWIEFTVERNGSISNVQTAKGIGGGCDEEVVRALQTLGSFEPAQQRGKKVRVKMVQPVIFQLKPDEVNADGTPQGMVIVGEAQRVESDLEVKASFSDGSWSGQVFDAATGEALPGANIVVEGTNLGTVSDLDGSFSVSSYQDQNLLVSFVGYKNASLEAAP